MAFQSHHESLLTGNSCDYIDEQLIEKLFPKCRPKRKTNNDVNQNDNDNEPLIDFDHLNDNKMNESSDLNYENICSDHNAMNSLRECEYRSRVGMEPSTVESGSKSFDSEESDRDNSNCNSSSSRELKLRESRIEIAGGREIFSASRRNMMINKKKCQHHEERRNVRKCNTGKRNNTTQTVNNEHLGDTKTIAVPIIHKELSDSCLTHSKSIEQKLASGIVVYQESDTIGSSEIIYDDINDVDNEKNLHLSVRPLEDDKNGITMHESVSKNDTSNSNLNINCSNEMSDNISECDSTKNFGKSSPSISPSNENEIARIIGNVPIARYEGSPRRYGPKPPGHPQRVYDNTIAIGVGNSNVEESKSLADISCDEIVKCILSIPLPNDDSSSSSISSKSIVQSAEISEHENVDKHNDSYIETQNIPSYDLSDLDYKLYRMETSGNAYVGKRLANISSVNSEDDRSESSSTAKSGHNDSTVPHENELIILHERVRQHILSEITAVDRASLSTCPGTEPDTEGGERVGEDTRNFTLSPETTDCDSNDVESEFSIGSSHSNSKLMTMPILEDGLSSGAPSSDNELDEETIDSPINFAFMKKQINDVKNEILTNLKANLLKNEQKYNPLPNGSVYAQENNDILLIRRNDDSKMHKNISNNDTQVIASNNCNNETANHDGEAIWIPRSKEPSHHQEEAKAEDDSAPSQLQHSHHDEECDTDQETDRLLGAQRNDDRGYYEEKNNVTKKTNSSREVLIHEPAVLIEGVLFRARYLGSTQLVCEGQPTKASRMMQAEEAVSRIKAPDGELQPSTDVDLFISTEKIMVLNTDLKEIMMDHSLRTISYIADIGDLLVLMARRRVVNSIDDPTEPNIKCIPKMICHVFESEEAQFIAQSIGQAFQVAYMEFLKANGIEDSSFVKEMDYQEVLNSQEIFGNELEMFAKKERQKEVIVPKQKGEILGMVIVESGWGSMLPTVVIANMAQQGPAARCGQLNIGDQIIAINGVSLVGLPLSTCQTYIKNTKHQNAVKFTVVPCAPVVEVKIKRPDTKYQLGFSVQNGVICSLLRGGIAERGGVRVGHRIIEINGQSVVAVPHDRIVNLLATSVGEIHMKTMPTSMFRLLTGQELPTYM